MADGMACMHGPVVCEAEILQVKLPSYMTMLYQIWGKSNRRVVG
jgi:hypothetical protein